MITYEAIHNEHSINTNKDKRLGCYASILDRMDKQYLYMAANHSRVLQVRFDLRYPKDGSIEPQKGDFTRFIKYLKRDLEKNYKLPAPGQQRYRRRVDHNDQLLPKRHNVDPQITLVVENHKKPGAPNPYPHAHALVFVNGNVKNNAYDIHARAIRSWNTAIGAKNMNGLVDFCNGQGPSSYQLDRNSPDFLKLQNDASYQRSYLAKLRGKDSRSKGSWLVMGTRIPGANKIGTCPARKEGVHG